MKTPKSSPAPSPAPAPEPAQPKPEPGLSAVALVTVEADKRPHRPSRLVPALHVITRLFYPLAVLSAGTYLFTFFGPSGWLWLVIGFVLLAIMAKPREVVA